MQTKIKTKIKYLVTFIALFIISACSSIPTEKVNQHIKAWEKVSFTELIKYWGLPDKSQQLDGKNYAEWIDYKTKPANSSVSVGGHNRAGGIGLGIGFTLFDLGSKEETCSRLVTYNDSDDIIEIRWQGTNDFCYKITPTLQESLPKISGNK